MQPSDLERLADTVAGLVDASVLLKNDKPARDELQVIIERGEFRPAEDEAIGYWFARYLSVREGLWDVIDDARELLAGRDPDPDSDLPLFVVGYAAACTLVGVDRVMLFDVAEHSVIQRKLNEAIPELRIPRRQFTRIFEAFIKESSVLALLDAMKFAKKHRGGLQALASDPVVGAIATQLPELETSLDPSKRAYLRGAWAFVCHKWRRRGVVTANTILSGVVEGVGRVASDIQLTDVKRVTDEIRRAIADELKPGDVLITRHATALTNLFMPGFWPHAALYVGTPEQRDALGVTVPDGKQALWVDDICTLEALKDGVRLRRLSDTLAVDFFVVLRPKLSDDALRQAIERGVAHEGKMYNFDFDFFSSDRLVCTEVVYRAYDGLEGLSFPLTDRAGRKTLSAEDLLAFALDEAALEPFAIFGVEGCESDVVVGGPVRDLLTASFRPQA